MSGGQQQILVFLRALIGEPKVLLLDEPFSALDYENTLKVRQKLLGYHSKNKTTIVIITHDIDEAVYLADEIIVLSNRPMKILGKMNNNINYPRNIKVLSSEKFRRTKSKVLNLFNSAIK
jgi:NitT/TauT family transport system ATP-binding protein